MNYSTLAFYRNIQNKNNIQLKMQDEIIAIVVAAIACVFLFIIIYIFSYWCRQPADTQSPFVYEDSFLSSRLASYGMLCSHFIFSFISSLCFTRRVAAIELRKLPQRHSLVGWLFVLRIYIALAIFQLYRDLEVGDNYNLKS